MNDLINILGCIGMLICLYFIVIYTKEVYRRLKLLDAWKKPGLPTFYWLVSPTAYDVHSYSLTIYDEHKREILFAYYTTRRSAIRAAFTFMDNECKNNLDMYNQREIYFIDQLKEY